MKYKHKFKRYALSLIVLVLTIAMLNMSNKIACSDLRREKGYCYDQAGDGHFCFESEHKCEQEQKKDDLAETPCYNQDTV